MSTDPAAALLRLVVRSLAARHAEWGGAMVAELSTIDGRRERLRFAAGCAVAVVRRPGGVLAATEGVIRAALLIAAVVFAWMIDDSRVRIEALAVVTGLVVVYGCLSSRIGFGPVAARRSARMASLAGVLAVAAESMLEFRRLRVDPPLTLPANATVGVHDTARATADLVALAIVLGLLLVALARVTAGRADVRARTVATGAGAAGVGAVGWLIVVLLFPAAATVAGPALLGMLAAGLVAGVAAGWSAAGVVPRQGMVAALLAAAGTATAIGVLMDLLPLNAHWVVNNAPPVFATHPPTRIVDTVVVWLPGLLAAAALTLTVRRRRTHPVA